MYSYQLHFADLYNTSMAFWAW